MVKESFRPIILYICAIIMAPAPVVAELVRFEIVEVESPYFTGRSFGTAGQYEMITAKATFAIDPDHQLNAVITDIDIAPRNQNGRVEAIADVAILRPIDVTKGNGRLFYEVLNRGDKISLILMNDAPWEGYYNPLDAGNGHLMNEGYTVVWSGWQGDMPSGENRMGLQVPVLENVVGLVWDEFIFNHNHDPFVATLSYPAASLDTDKAKLTVRARQTHARVTPEDLTFEYFVAERAGIAPYTDKQIVIHRPDGFDANAIYEFTYEARNPSVMGLAFATVRDLVSFIKNSPEDKAGNPNPFFHNQKPIINYAYGLGISQSGRFVRDYLYQGFNQDELGRMVFDGLMPDVAGSRKTWTNFRFAQPGRYSREHEAHLQPGDQFPFTYGVMEDPLTGVVDGILKKCIETDTCPKVFHTDTATEFWQARASLVVTDTNGNDIALPDNVRAYYMTGTPHSEVFGTEPYAVGSCQNLSNVLQNGGPMRALLHALDLWVREGVEPPDSEFPSVADGTLVHADQKSVGFPLIPDVAFPGVINRLRVTDYKKFPPQEGALYPIFVPKVDRDGNEVAGIRLPDVSVPIATYTGWNIRTSGTSAGSLCSVVGSTIPFERKITEQIRRGDPRAAIEERYISHQAYVEQVRNAANSLFKKRLLLAEDIELYVELAMNRDIGIQLPDQL